MLHSTLSASIRCSGFVTSRINDDRALEQKKRAGHPTSIEKVSRRPTAELDAWDRPIHVVVSRHAEPWDERWLSYDATGRVTRVREAKAVWSWGQAFDLWLLCCLAAWVR